MHLAADNKDQLKEWLLRRLHKTGSRSDADVLADYCLALLERDLDITEHHKYMIGELETFIDDSKEFTAALFRAIQGLVIFKFYFITI